MAQVIDCHCFLYDKDLDAMGVDVEHEAKLSFLATELSGVREQFTKDGEVIPDRCIVFFKNGDNTLIDQPFKTMRQVLKSTNEK